MLTDTCGTYLQNLEMIMSCMRFRSWVNLDVTQLGLLGFFNKDKWN